MAQKTPKNGPPKYVARIVATLTPRAFRAALALRLTANYTTLPNYFIDAAQGISRVTRVQAMESFNPFRLFGDLCCLFIAFSASPHGARAVVLFAALAALIYRDAHTHPAEASYAECAMDALMVATAITVCETILLLAWPSFAPSLPDIASQLAIAVCMLSAWRFIFRAEKPPERPVLPSYRSAFWTNMMWFIGVGGLLVANTRIVPAKGFRDFAIIVIPVVIFMIDFLMRSNAIGAVRGPQAFGSIVKHEEEELTAQQNRVIGTNAAPKYVEAAFFVAVAFPIGSPLVSTLFGAMTADNVNWMQLVTNTAALAVLGVLWTRVKKLTAHAQSELRAKLKGAS